jgi:hypothetical protein
MRLTRGIVLLSVAAFIVAFMLFMPFGCSASSLGPWSCVTIFGVELPGFSGRGPLSPSYLPPLVAGLIAAIVVFGTGQLVRRPSKLGRVDRSVSSIAHALPYLSSSSSADSAGMDGSQGQPHSQSGTGTRCDQ